MNKVLVWLILKELLFELFSLDPFWLIAKATTLYHLYRTINEHQPQLLSEKEKNFYLRTKNIRSFFAKKLKPLREKLRSIIKKF